MSTAGATPPLAMCREQRIGHLQKLRPGEQVEKIHHLGLIRVADDGLGMLLRSKLGITISQGWPSRLLVVLLGNNILSILAASLLLNFQSVSPTRRPRLRLKSVPFALNWHLRSTSGTRIQRAQGGFCALQPHPPSPCYRGAESTFLRSTM